MKRYLVSIVFLMIAFSVNASVGVVDLGVVYNFHPYVLLYYYPEYNAFMRPISGPLSSSNIERVRKERSKKASQLAAKIKRESKELDSKITKLENQYTQLQKRIQHERQLSYEKTQRIIANGKNIKAANAEAAVELSKKILPLKDKMLKISNEKKKIENQKQELQKGVFYVNFTNKKETLEMNKKILSEIKNAIKKVSSSSGVSLVLNSSFWKYQTPESITTDINRVMPDYNRVAAIVGEFNDKHLSRAELNNFTNAYINDIIKKEKTTIPGEYMGRFILDEYTDLTYAVVKYLQKDSKINQKVKSAIHKFLQYKTMK